MGRIAAIWGVVGVVAMLVEAVYRLVPPALEPFDHPLSWWQGGLYAGFTVANAWAEGYRGFQLRFAPRVIARARYLAAQPTLLHGLLAPAFVMCLYHTTRRRLIATWSLVAAIVVLVLLVRHLPQPWRGIIDAGVVAGLAWGIASILIWSTRPTLPVDPDLPRGRS